MFVQCTPPIFPVRMAIQSWSYNKIQDQIIRHLFSIFLVPEIVMNRPKMHWDHVSFVYSNIKRMYLYMYVELDTTAASNSTASMNADCWLFQCKSVVYDVCTLYNVRMWCTLYAQAHMLVVRQRCDMARSFLWITKLNKQWHNFLILYYYYYCWMTLTSNVRTVLVVCVCMYDMYL